MLSSTNKRADYNEVVLIFNILSIPRFYLWEWTLSEEMKTLNNLDIFLQYVIESQLTLK